MKIISGGQTGADRTALEVAQELGFETGGFAPKGFRTETGPDPSLEDFGLVELGFYLYPPRTRANVNAADATIWFGGTGDRGFQCTRNAAFKFRKPFFINPSASELLALIGQRGYTCLNIAGNAASRNRDIEAHVRGVLGETLKNLKRIEDHGKQSRQDAGTSPEAGDDGSGVPRVVQG